MTLQTYNNMTVSIIRNTPNPGALVRLALDITQKKTEYERVHSSVSPGTLLFLTNANHGSIIEHVTFTILIQGVSRAFLAQITRHRMASYTSASQHYQDYRDYPMVVSEQLQDNVVMQANVMNSISDYKYMIDEMGVKPEEARMCLPNAACVNILWTINARSLANFMSQRMCKRNVEEMQTFAHKLLFELNMIWPEYAKTLGPECYRLGMCLQGKMSCGKPFPKVEL